MGDYRLWAFHACFYYSYKLKLKDLDVNYKPLTIIVTS